jgi:dephospho-CoA kinase
MNKTHENIVGVGGLPRSGKDTLADFLIERGYYGFSFGDYTRTFTRERHKDDVNPISVENMTETSNWLRETYGPDVILQAALKEFEEKQATGEQYNGLVLYSVRAPVEADWILAHNGALIWVEASDEVRYERSMRNLREGEGNISLEEFKRQEALQWQPQPGIAAESQMNLAYIKQYATFTFENNENDLDVFKSQVKKILKLA